MPLTPGGLSALRNALIKPIASKAPAEQHTHAGGAAGGGGGGPVDTKFLVTGVPEALVDESGNHLIWG